MFSREYLICTCKCLFREIYYQRKFLRLRYIYIYIYTHKHEAIQKPTSERRPKNSAETIRKCKKDRKEPHHGLMHLVVQYLESSLLIFSSILFSFCAHRMASCYGNRYIYILLMLQLCNCTRIYIVKYRESIAYAVWAYVVAFL